VPWLQPMPDALVADDDPASAAVRRGSLRLALVAALQLLPPRQRAVLMLREVLEWSAQETAGALEMSVPAVNSALQRARARLADADLQEDEITEPARNRAMVDRYVAAFERADLAELRTLLTREAVLEMPPYLNWFVGADDYVRFIARAYAMRGTDWRMLPLSANGQSGVAAYVRGADGRYALHTVQLFAVTPDGIAHTTVFQDPVVFALFELPETLERS